MTQLIHRKPDPEVGRRTLRAGMVVLAVVTAAVLAFAFGPDLWRTLFTTALVLVGIAAIALIALFVQDFFRADPR